jgi:phosphatidate cytidylyltransferase
VTRGDLARRLATAAIGLPLLALTLFWAPPMVTVLLGAVVAAIGLWEFYALLGARGVVALRRSGFVLAAAFFLQTVRPALVPPALVPIAAMIVLVAMLTRASDVPGSVTSAAATLLGAAWLGGLGGTMAALRLAPPERGGPWVLMLLLTTVMMGDSAALFVGSAVGRHKMAPRISPGKTWEGLAGGLAGAIVGALIVRHFGLQWIPRAQAVVLAVLVALAGMAGDLAESLLKRWAGVKDSGALFPGHGGMLDRLDSLLLGAPVLYYYLLYAR